MPELFRSSRIFGLDVLRAVAIATVMLSHAPGNGLPLEQRFSVDGVSLFFVLSGFLIGTILIRTFSASRPDIAILLDFWKRRWLRTLPAYLFMLTVLVIASAVTDGVPRNVLAYYFFCQNLAWPHPPFFGEAWSLSVEEWFYLVIPLTTFVAMRSLQVDVRRTLLAIITSVIVASVCLRAYRIISLDMLTFVEWDESLRKIVILRSDSLMFGMLGAYLCRFHSVSWHALRWPAFVAGILLLLADACLMPRNLFWRNWISLEAAPLATLLMLPLANSCKTAPWLILVPVTFVSLVSYSLYLTHRYLVLFFVLPHLARLRPEWFSSPSAEAMWYWLLSFACGFLVYAMIERPFMLLRKPDKVSTAKTELEHVTG